jgi:predicted dehydrogenase
MPDRAISTAAVVHPAADSELGQALRVAVVGLGHWGPNHVRTFSSLQETRVVAVSDKDESRIARVKRMAPNAQPMSLEQILDDPKVDAVVVATPASTHTWIVEACVRAGKDVLCEKPLTDSLELATLQV